MVYLAEILIWRPGKFLSVHQIQITPLQFYSYYAYYVAATASCPIEVMPTMIFDQLAGIPYKIFGKELNLPTWQTKTKSPIFHLANVFCTHLTQNLAHDLYWAVVQIEQSLVKYLTSMSSASNTFEQ